MGPASLETLWSTYKYTEYLLVTRLNPTTSLLTLKYLYTTGIEPGGIQVDNYLRFLPKDTLRYSPV
jgi:hypothetical protein